MGCCISSVCPLWGACMGCQIPTVCAAWGACMGGAAPPPYKHGEQHECCMGCMHGVLHLPPACCKECTHGALGPQHCVL